MSVSGHNLFSEILYLYIEVKYPKRIMAPPIACENRLLEKMHKMYHFYLQLVLLIYKRFHLGLQNLWALMGLQQTLIGNFFCNQIMRRNMYWASVCDTVQWTYKCQKNITVWIKKKDRDFILFADKVPSSFKLVKFGSFVLHSINWLIK